MDNGRISTRYAKALYEYARERGKEEVIYEEMKFIAEVFFLTPKLTKVLENPRIPTQVKKTLLLDAAGGNVSAEFKRFVDFVIEKKRESFFHIISLRYQSIYRKSRNIVIGRLVTARPIDAQQEKRMNVLIAARTHKEVDFVVAVRPELIGGFTLRIGTYQLDASLSSQLKRIKKELLQASNRGS
ncbi:F0F1 ATP synthase subunit delta [Bacteroidia bacterium]|nr:F0F1 ATP synthase subunit delta [Bacteroidia bacterium]